MNEILKPLQEHLHDLHKEISNLRLKNHYQSESNSAAKRKLDRAIFIIAASVIVNVVLLIMYVF